jgi:cytochrome P450
MTSTENSPRREADEFDTDLDHHSAEFAKDPLRRLAELRSRCPVAKSSQWGGFWLLTGYDEVFEALHTPEVFSSRPSEHGVRGVPPQPGAGSLVPIDYDQPDVGVYRSFLLSALSPGSAREMQPMIREMANDFIDQFIERGTADVTQELFTPLPAQLILRLLGLDASRWAEWVVWVHGFVHDPAVDPEGAVTKVMAMFAEIYQAIGSARAQPQPGLLGELVAAERDGRALTDDELANTVFLLILGGMDTTAGLTGNSLLLIDAQPELRKQILDDPSVLDQGTEEFLRYATPVLSLPRTVTEDTEFHGRQLKKGEQVLIMWAAANRDPSQFEDPETLDLSRKATRHMAFGLGVHRCLGSNLARVMFKTMIIELLTRAPDLAVRTSGVVRYDDASPVYAVRHLPITFTPGQRKSAENSSAG